MASIHVLGLDQTQGLPALAAGLAKKPESESSFDLFTGISQADRMKVDQLATRQSFARNELLFSEGEAIDRVWMLESGFLKLTQTSQNGSEVILWLRGPSEFIGLPSIGSSGVHTCSARSVLKGTALVWEWEALSRLESAAQIRWNIGHILSERVTELERRFCEVAAENVPTRVASLLARILSRIGDRTEEGIEVNLSRLELAQLTGATLFTVSRLMSKWEASGYVVSRRRTVLVPYPHRFAEMCATKI